MAYFRQRVRMAAVRSALEVLRHRQFTTGYGLVVLGGAYAPSTKIDTNVFDNIDHKDFDSFDFISSQSSLSPGTPLGRHLVVSGGDITTAHTHLNSSIDTLTKCGTSLVHTLCIFQSRTPLPLCTDTFGSVVPGRFWRWSRAGIG